MSTPRFCLTDYILPKSRSVINFAPGPAKLPESVIDKAQRELHEYATTGVSILEISHRSPEFLDILKRAQMLMRDLLHIPNEYEILFLQGGATGQFAAIPLNLMHLSKSEKPCADYVVTGSWSSKAQKEASKYLTANKVINPPLQQYTRIPDESTWALDPDAAYVYICDNETVHGVEYHFVPDTHGIPIVTDVSSNFLSKPVDISKYGIMYGGVQKNIGAAGLTCVIIRKDLMGKAHKMCPSIFDYKEQHAMNSIYNTPPVFSIYLTKLVLEWIRDQGGLETIADQSQQKSQLIYDAIDDSKGFYNCALDGACRSRMNIPFRVGGEQGNVEMEKEFIKEAEIEGMMSLKGHRSVGGIRASLYNAVSVEETECLQQFMQKFYEKHGLSEC